MKKNIFLLLMVAFAGHPCISQIQTPRLNDVPNIKIPGQQAAPINQQQARAANPQQAVAATTNEAYITNKASRQINFSYSTDGGENWYSRTIQAGDSQTIPVNSNGEVQVKLSTNDNVIKYRLINKSYSINWNTDKGRWGVFDN